MQNTGAPSIDYLGFALYAAPILSDLGPQAVIHIDLQLGQEEPRLTGAIRIHWALLGAQQLLWGPTRPH